MLTGAASGKINLDGTVRLQQKVLEGAEIFIHLKGYSRARVTHLDIEHPELKILPPKRGRFATLQNEKNGLTVKIGAQCLTLECSRLKDLLITSEKTVVWVGGKTGGLYLGFKRPYVKKLELLAEKLLKLGRQLGK